MDYKLRGTEQILKAIFLSILMILVLSEFAYARVIGVCSNCHTMHNSQNATSMRLDSTPITGAGAGECLDCHAATRAVLLRLDCLGCHAKAINGASNIIDGWPQIALDTAATDANSPPSLAGGNYKYVFSDDNRGHNVHGFGGIIVTDNNLGNNPPGYKSDYDPSTGKYQPGNTAGQVMCAGQNGCHGNRNQLSPILAMKGTHHANDSILKFGSGFTETGQGGGTGSTSDFTTAGKSYRFLYNVHGAEDANWEGVTPGPTVHNEYFGKDFASRTSMSNYTMMTGTISELCAECHGDFHTSGSSGIGSASPWLRHPTDKILTNSGEYTGYTAYSTEAPVARPQSFFVTGLANADSVVTPGTDIVMCLSCHRAHASQYPDALRWDYSNMSAGRGCYICHTQKDDNL